MALVSMTGFASLSGQGDGLDWQWDARSVNGRGLDIRIRLPEGLDGLDQPLRKAAQDRMTRGNVQIGLRVVPSEGGEAAQLNRAALDQYLSAAAEVEAAAMVAGIALQPMTAAEILSQRGLMDAGRGTDRAAAQAEAIAGQVPALIDALAAARRAEGAALAAVLSRQIDQVEALTAAAATTAEARAARAGEVLHARVAALLGAQDRIDEGRLAQELALLAVKADVTEEIDRLTAHVAAARLLLKATEPVGRKLDFLMQEFNREANTLCSKAQDSDLTRIGLDLKVVIDQMREQAQNVE